MNKDELREKQNRTMESLNDIKAMLGLDALYIDELEQENAELKSRDCWKGCLYASGKSELIHKFLQQKYNLTKAKEIIKTLLEFVNNEVEYDPENPQEHTDLWNELCENAEQFLKENE